MIAEDLRELYQEFILDHGRNPRNFRTPEHVTHFCDGYNPLCGDKLTVKANVQDGVVADIGFEGSGCAISVAAASTMTEAVKGKDLKTIEQIFKGFHTLVTTGVETGDLGKLAVFAGVAEFPMRVKCATLAWHTLEHALEKSSEPAVTE